MAVVWGEAEVVLHTDGRALPGEVQAAVTEAATVGGKAFQRHFRREMAKAAAVAVADFARSFTRALSRLVTSSRAFQDLSRRLRFLRTDFVILGNYVKGTFLDAVGNLRTGFRNLIQPLRDFRQEIGDQSTRAIEELREGMSHLRISADDLRQTFPAVARVIDGTRTRFLRFRGTLDRVADGVRDFGDRAMARLRPVADEVGTAWERLSDRFSRFRETIGANNVGVRDLRAAMENLRVDIEGVSNATDQNEQKQRRLRRATDDNVTGIRKLLAGWKRLPHGFRQAVFWTGLVIAAMGSLSVLTSALSGTIVALVTQIGALAAGLGFAVAGFAGLYAENAKLTEGAIASRDAFARLGDAFAGIRDTITNNMFAGMEESINNLTNVLLPSLESNIASFSATVGASLSRIFDALSSPAGVENFKALLDGFSPILESLTTAAITFGDAIADILVASLPTAQLFADAIADVGTQFSTWTSSEEGRARLAEFFATAERIMPSIVALVVAFADALAELVTPTTISGFEQFVTSMTNFMPILGQIVGLVANLNIFGILAASLELIGALLAPILPPLSQFATILGVTLVDGLIKLAPEFEKLGTALAPILQFLGELIIAILPPLIDLIVVVIDNISAWVDMFTALGEAFGDGGDGATEFGEVVGNVFSVLGGIIAFNTSVWTGILRAISALLRGDVSGAFTALEDGVRAAFEGIGVDFDAMVMWLATLWFNVQNFFGKIVREIQNFGRDVGKVFSGVIGWIQDAVGWFNSLFGAANKASGATSSARSSAGGGAARAMASGGTLFGPTRILAGEAGPEAIVPLRRSLSQVDPSVRWLSAIAQGKMPSFASGGIVGGGRTLNIQSGAIVVEDRSGDPRRTGNEVVQRIVERVAG